MVIFSKGDDLSIFDTLPQNQILVYNKGRAPKTNHKWISIPDIGDDVYAYLLYIIEYYSALPEMVLFYSGDYRGKNGVLDLQHLFQTSTNSDNFQSNFILDSPLWMGKLGDVYAEENFVRSSLEFREYFKIYGTSDVDFDIPIYWGNTFSAFRSYLYTRSIRYCKDLLRQVSYHSSEAAHFIRGSWFYILNMHKPIPAQ